MAQGRDDHAAGMSRRGALTRLAWGAGMLGAVTALPERWSPFGRARAAQGPTIPVIVKDPARPYWQAVLAGARKAADEAGAQILALGGKAEEEVPQVTAGNGIKRCLTGRSCGSTIELPLKGPIGSLI